MLAMFVNSINRAKQRTIKFYLVAICLVSILFPYSLGASGAAQSGVKQVPFAQLIKQLSEPGGFFFSDNLVSNEASYLHVVPKLEELGIRGGVYLGVGPEQNFTYIARTRPARAFILDIRRDNMVQHLMFKALFIRGRTRAEYLSLLFSKPLNKNHKRLKDATIGELVSYFDHTPTDEALFKRNLEKIKKMIRDDFGVTLTEDDLKSLDSMYRSFSFINLNLRYETSYGRSMQPYLPTLRTLLLERNLDGKQQNYLAAEEDYQFVRRLHEQDLIVPVTGDFAGPHALKAIGDYIRSLGERVSVFYTSNVEYYLMRNGVFPQFVESVRRLPIDDRSVFIRSFFGFGYNHPEAVPGYFGSTHLQKMSNFLKLYDQGRYRSYYDLGIVDYISVRE